MPTIKFDAELDAQLERLVPEAYQGRRRCGVRVDYAIRRLLETAAGGCACRPSSPAETTETRLEPCSVPDDQQ